MTSAPQSPIRLRQFAGMLALPMRVGAPAPLTTDETPIIGLDELAQADDSIVGDCDRDGFTSKSPRFASAVAALVTAAAILTTTLRVEAQPVSRRQAMAAAIHPVATPAAMQHWLSRVPVTRDFPPDLPTTLRAQAPLYVIETTTSPGCLPCGDLWGKLQQLRLRHGIEVRTIAGQEAMLRSGRLGLPWVGHPVAWMRPKADPNRMIPIAVGTDHAANLTRNLYLAVKMLTGVRPAVAVRAMSKFTGIVGVAAPAPRKR